LDVPQETSDALHALAEKHNCSIGHLVHAALKKAGTIWREVPVVVKIHAHSCSSK
jgi:hypothetical protein